MKKYFKIFGSVLAIALIFTGCTTYTRAGYGGGYYDSYYGYGDGQPNDYFYYNDNQQSQYNNNAAYQQPSAQVSLSFNDFYHQLAPHGTWLNLAPYGQVWVANVPNFQPYSSNGYWANTNYGWTWVSNYSWGWAPFHYGRWGYNNRYGWYWVPGYVWGPAWVAWSSSSDMYGWAPLMPGMGYNVSLHVDLFPSSYWTFMHGRYMGMNNIGGYYVNRSQNVTIIKNTTIINNYGVTESNRRFTMGPSSSDVQRHTGRSVQVMQVTSVSDNTRTGVNGNELRVYRPAASSSGNGRSSSSETTRTQQNQQTSTRSGTPQAGAQQQTTTRSSDASQTRSQQQQTQQTTTRSSNTQSSTQQDTRQSTYQRDPVQPRVTNNASPQTTRQIQAAEEDKKKVQQQQRSSSTTTTRSSSSPTTRSSSSTTTRESTGSSSSTSTPTRSSSSTTTTTRSGGGGSQPRR